MIDTDDFKKLYLVHENEGNSIVYNLLFFLSNFAIYTPTSYIARGVEY
jgi:hypothetical protein